MTWILLLMMLPIAGFLYWAGFYATKDMRIKKNAMRLEQANKNLERQRLEKENQENP
ncbi:MAG: hypothetical protein COA61_004205 [Zetaproteobacteria bacterium]|nr:hypothetical protein [Zetaproteobacteria bacterium]